MITFHFAINLNRDNSCTDDTQIWEEDYVALRNSLIKESKLFRHDLERTFSKNPGLYCKKIIFYLKRASIYIQFKDLLFTILNIMSSSRGLLSSHEFSRKVKDRQFSKVYSSFLLRKEESTFENCLSFTFQLNSWDDNNPFEELIILRMVKRRSLNCI